MVEAVLVSVGVALLSLIFVKTLSWVVTFRKQAFQQIMKRYKEVYVH